MGKNLLEFSLLGRCDNSLGKWRAAILLWFSFFEKIPGALEQSPRNYAEFQFSKKALKLISCGINVTLGPLRSCYIPFERALRVLFVALWVM